MLWPECEGLPETALENERIFSCKKSNHPGEFKSIKKKAETLCRETLIRVAQSSHRPESSGTETKTDIYQNEHFSCSVAMLGNLFYKIGIAHIARKP